MVHVCYTLRDVDSKYSKFAGTSITSIFENTQELVKIHVLIDSTVKQENIDKLIDITSKYGQKIQFYNVDKLISGRIDEIKKAVPRLSRHWATVAVFYRLIIPELINESKIIYLDADTVINRDINDMWSVDCKNAPVAAVSEYLSGVLVDNLKRFLPVRLDRVNWQNYFNAGVLLLDLNQIRKHSAGDLLTRCLNYLRDNPSSTHLDQDALNYIFTSSYFHLPETFNQLVDYARSTHRPLTNAIYHYVTTTLKIDSKDPFNRLWFKYFQMTPFYDKKVFDNAQTFAQNQLKNYQTSVNKKMEQVNKVLKLMNQRQQVYFMNPAEQSKIKEKFKMIGSVVGMDSTKKSSLDALVNEMKKTNSADSTDKKIYMIYVSDAEYKTVQKKLIDNKFVEFEDFVNANDLFNPPPTIRLDSHSMIRGI